MGSNYGPQSIISIYRGLHNLAKIAHTLICQTILHKIKARNKLTIKGPSPVTGIGSVAWHPRVECITVSIVRIDTGEKVTARKKKLPHYWR